MQFSTDYATNISYCAYETTFDLRLYQARAMLQRVACCVATWFSAQTRLPSTRLIGLCHSNLRSACGQKCSQQLLIRAQVPMSLSTQLTVAGLSIVVLIVGSTFVGVFWCRCPTRAAFFLRHAVLC